jgi:hypothetical protein
VKVEKVVVAPVYKLEATADEIADLRMVLHEGSIDNGYLQATRDRLKVLYDVVRSYA